MIVMCVQTTILGGWIDVYKGHRLLFTKRFKDVGELQAIKDAVNKIKGVS